MKSPLIACFLLFGLAFCKGQNIHVDTNQKYKDYIRIADSCFNGFDKAQHKYSYGYAVQWYWSQATLYYTWARLLKPNQQHPKEQLCKLWVYIMGDRPDLCSYCKDSAKAVIQKYKYFVALGDSLMVHNSYNAWDYYVYALKLKPDSKHVKGQLCKLWTRYAIVPGVGCSYCKDSAKAKRLKYKNMVALADSSFNKRSYNLAEQYYKFAATIREPDEYVAQRIKLCNEPDSLKAIQRRNDDSKHAQDNGYSDLIAEGNSYFKTIISHKNEYWSIMKEDKLFPHGYSDSGYHDFHERSWATYYYQQALKLKPDEVYPKKQLCKLWVYSSDLDYRCKYCEDSVKSLKLKYQHVQVLADTTFAMGDYESAKWCYTYLHFLNKHNYKAEKRIHFCDSALYNAEMTFEKDTIDIDTVYFYHGILFPIHSIVVKFPFKNTGTVPIRNPPPRPCRVDTCTVYLISRNYPEFVKPNQIDTVTVSIFGDYDVYLGTTKKGPFRVYSDIGCNCLKPPHQICIKGYLVRDEFISPARLYEFVNTFLFEAHYSTGPYGFYKYSNAELMPTFPGGQDSLIEYLQRKTICEQADYSSKYFIKTNFVVEKDGSISQIKMTYPQVIGTLDTTEAFHIIESMPKWLPGKELGYNVRVKCEVDFYMHEKKTRKMSQN